MSRQKTRDSLPLTCRIPEKQRFQRHFLYTTRSRRRRSGLPDETKARGNSREHPLAGTTPGMAAAVPREGTGVSAGAAGGGGDAVGFPTVVRIDLRFVGDSQRCEGPGSSSAEIGVRTSHRHKVVANVLPSQSFWEGRPGRQGGSTMPKKYGDFRDPTRWTPRLRWPALAVENLRRRPHAGSARVIVSRPQRTWPGPAEAWCATR